MSTAIVCPSPEELARIGKGDCAGSCPDGLATHIDSCPACREFLERRVQDGLESLTSRAAELPVPDAVPQIHGFTIERELGRGAMGVVYLARRDTPRRQVALKLLPGGRLAGPRERRQWLREAEAASSVRHPNVVTLYEVGEVDDCFLLVLEYIPGGTLADRLSEPLAPRHAARLMETIARAVHHIHQCGQLHLDLKPSNILLDGEAGARWDVVIPKVSDFGIARAAEAGATETGGPGAGGTPSYMAPEQITKERKDVTVVADVHGLGAILYHMLTGRPPYQGATVLETIDFVQRQEPVPPRRLNPKIPSDLETICLKCLEKDPARRYASAELLADDLGRWLDGRAISARPASPVEKSWRWCRRRPVIAALAAALALTVSFGFAVAIVLWRHAEGARARAEANLRLSNEVLAELYSSIGERGGAPKAMSLDQLVHYLERVKKLLVVSARNQPDDLLMAHHLASVEIRLAERLQQARRHQDALAVLLESQERLELLARRVPLNEALRDVRAMQFHLLATVSEGLGRTEDSINYLTRAIQSREEEIRLTADARGLTSLVVSRRHLGWLLFSRGEHDRTRSLFAENRRVVETLPSECQGVNTTVQRLLAHIDLNLVDAGLRSDTVAGAGMDLVGHTGLLSRLRSPADESQAPEDWAKVAAELLRSAEVQDSRARQVGNRRTSSWWRRTSSATASRFNRAGRMDEAARIAERMLALGEFSVERHSFESTAHLALHFAYVQLYKNAYQTDDWAAVETNMKLARDAAQVALDLDADSELAQQAVQSVERRLADLDGDT